MALRNGVNVKLIYFYNARIDFRKERSNYGVFYFIGFHLDGYEIRKILDLFCFSFVDFNTSFARDDEGVDVIYALLQHGFKHSLHDGTRDVAHVIFYYIADIFYFYLFDAAFRKLGMHATHFFGEGEVWFNNFQEFGPYGRGINGIADTPLDKGICYTVRYVDSDVDLCLLR